MSENINLQNEENVIVATFNITRKNTTITLQNLTGMTSIYWGDGVIDSNLSHTYNEIGVYTCKSYDVTTIGTQAFSNCSSLTSVVIPDSVTTIGNYAFGWCDSLTSVVIPDSVTSIGKSAFYDCDSLTSVVIGNGVTSIGDYTFKNCSSLTSVVIPNSVTSIGEGAFRNCSSLTSVVISDSVTSIGKSAFYNCDSLTSVVIGNGVTSIGDYAFNNCNKLTSVVIPDSVTSIGNKAFTSCSSLTGVYITDIAAWCNISNLYNLMGYGSSSKSLYLNNELVRELVIPDGVTSIGYSAFKNCSSLTSVVIPNSVTSIGSYAFYDCDSLTSVEIGNGVTSIGDFAFRNCSSLTSAYITDIAAWCNISFGVSGANPLYYAKNLYLNNQLVTELIIPDGVTSIGDRAFADCNSLTSVEIGDSVTSIGDSAFAYCSNLTSVVIPDSVTSIGDWAFEGCRGLTSLTFKSLIPIPKNMLSGSIFDTSTIIFYVPKEAIEAYRSAWSGIIEPDKIQPDPDGFLINLEDLKIYHNALKEKYLDSMVTQEYVDNAVAAVESSQADYNQNDETAKDYIKNRPFYDTASVILEWDGNPEGRDSFIAGDILEFIKISDILLEEIPSKIEYNDSGIEKVIEIKNDDNTLVNEAPGCKIIEVYIASEETLCILIVSDVELTASSLEGATPPSTGTYFGNIVDSGKYIKKLYGLGNIKTLDPKFLPEGTATEEYVDEQINNLEIPTNYITKVGDQTGIIGVKEGDFEIKFYQATSFDSNYGDLATWETNLKNGEISHEHFYDANKGYEKFSLDSYGLKFSGLFEDTSSASVNLSYLGLNINNSTPESTQDLQIGFEGIKFGIDNNHDSPDFAVYGKGYIKDCNVAYAENTYTFPKELNASGTIATREWVNAQGFGSSGEASTEIKFTTVIEEGNEYNPYIYEESRLNSDGLNISYMMDTHLHQSVALNLKGLFIEAQDGSSIKLNRGQSEIELFQVGYTSTFDTNNLTFSNPEWEGGGFTKYGKGQIEQSTAEEGIVNTYRLSQEPDASGTLATREWVSAQISGTPLDDDDLVPLGYMKQYIRDNFAALMAEYLANNTASYNEIITTPQEVNE